ncbi:hypothetical protein KGY47_03475 [Candidatus Bipolaricaulota bacterium]|nr:hypothetical protein [Candidatus Bipolaricaulota bacterium]
MKKSITITLCLVITLILTISLAGFGQEDFSADLLIVELRRAERLISSGKIAQGLDSLLGVSSILDSNIRELSDAAGKETESTASGDDLEIGFVNAQEAFTVFTQAVEEERKSAQKKSEELVSLRESALKGEISESEYKKERDILQAEKLKAQLDIDIAMLDRMLKSEGFKSVSDKLFNLKEQVKPIMDELEKVLKDIREGSAVPEEISQTLSQIHNQYEQLDNLLTKLIETKIFQITNVRAKEKGYDLVLRQENVVLYRNRDRIDNLTEMTKEALRKEIGSE